MNSTNHEKPGSSGNINRLVLVLVVVGIGANLSAGTIVSALKLPLFCDAIGTIAVTLLAGIRPGIATGVLSFLLGGLLVNPVMPYFAGTQAAIAIYIGCAARFGVFSSWFKTIIIGLGLGVVAAIVSAPVIVALFGGITGSGSGFITAFLIASGKSVIKSVFLTGLACEPIDKTLQCLLAVWLIRSLPNRARLPLLNYGWLKKNRLLCP